MMERLQENLYGYVGNFPSAFIDVQGKFGFALPALLNPVGLTVAAVAVTTVAITEVIQSIQQLLFVMNLRDGLKN